jgi:5-methyltetrahydrofolate--homocysteine methyltransferase
LVDLGALAQHVIDGREGDVSRLTKQAIDDGVPAQDVLEKGLIAGMQVVGQRFRANEIFLPEVLVAARAMKAGMTHLEPVMAACGIPPVGKLVIGTVKGDIHDIGKNLVTAMLRGAGFQVIDLGINVPLNDFVHAIEQHQPDIVGMSALLTTTMQQMKINLDGFRQRGLLDRVRVLIGGATVTKEWAASIGADYARDAMSAVQKAQELLHDKKANAARGTN